MKTSKRSVAPEEQHKPDADRYSFGYCALQYLLTWLRHEKPLHELMRGQGDRMEAGIKAALPYFQVARNFAGISGDERKLSIVRRAIERADASVHDPVRCVTDLAADLENNFGKNLVSAASKLLWLRHRSPFVIYDSRAVAALHIRPKDGYTEYWERWHSAYREIKPEIKIFGDAPQFPRKSALAGR